MSDAVTETLAAPGTPSAARFLRWEAGAAVFRVPSGRYRFEAGPGDRAEEARRAPR